MAPLVQEEQPAVTLDWMLKIAEAIAAARTKKLEQAGRS